MSIEDARCHDPDALECFGGAQRAADLAKVPEVLALAARLHFEARLRADVAVQAAQSQHHIGYCYEEIHRRLFELGLQMVHGAEPLESQVRRLSEFIIENIPGEPSRSEGAVDTALRLLRDFYVPAMEVQKPAVAR